MLRSLLLLLWTLSTLASAFDRADPYLPRSGQSVDIFNGDLTTKIGRVRMDIRQEDELYTLRGEDIPTLHFLADEQRFSVPGVTATEKAQTFDEQGAVRMVYRGAHIAGTIEKHAQIELVKFDEGRCQLSWKLSVMNRGERVRNQQGSMAYDCQKPQKIKEHRRAAMHLLPER